MCDTSFSKRIGANGGLLSRGDITNGFVSLGVDVSGTFDSDFPVHGLVADLQRMSSAWAAHHVVRILRGDPASEPDPQGPLYVPELVTVPSLAWDNVPEENGQYVTTQRTLERPNPAIQLDAKALTGAQVIERLIAGSLFLWRELSQLLRMGSGYEIPRDVRDLPLLRSGSEATKARLFQALLQQVFALTENEAFDFFKFDPIPAGDHVDPAAAERAKEDFTFARILAMRLMLTHLQIAVERYKNDKWDYFSGFSQDYSGLKHRFYNGIVNFDAVGGFPFYGEGWEWPIFPLRAALDPILFLVWVNDLGKKDPSPPSARLMPLVTKRFARVVDDAVQDDLAGDDYKWPRIALDPNVSTILNNPLEDDPDGFNLKAIVDEAVANGTIPPDYTPAQAAAAVVSLYNQPGTSMDSTAFKPWVVRTLASGEQIDQSWDQALVSSPIIGPRRSVPRDKYQKGDELVNLEDDPDRNAAGQPIKVISGFETQLKYLMSGEFESPPNPVTQKEAEHVFAVTRDIYEHEVLPALKRVYARWQQRQADSHDDAYAGAWRAKVPTVKSVERAPLAPDALPGVLGVMLSFKTRIAGVWIEVLDDEDETEVPHPYDTLINVPRLAADNELPQYADQSLDNPDIPADEQAAIVQSFFESAQAGIAEMEEWLTSTLYMALGTTVGDEFLAVQKADLSFGYHGDQTPYASAQAIVANYKGLNYIVLPAGEPAEFTPGEPIAGKAPIEILVSLSGANLVLFFDDLKGYLATIWQPTWRADGKTIQEVSDEAAAESINTSTSAQPQPDPNAGPLNWPGGNRSDLQELGRHYGYTAAGVKTFLHTGDDSDYYEWNVGGESLHYNFAAPAAGSEAGTVDSRKQFDYVYRQHYEVDPDAPLAVGNDRDPARADEPLTPDDDAYNQAAVVDEFDVFDGLQGTFFRFRGDNMLQRLTKFIIDTADLPSKQLLPTDFLEEFYRPYLVNTYDEPDWAENREGEIKIFFRVVDSAGGSASSGGGILFRPSKVIQQVINLPTRDPVRIGVGFANLVGLLLHEGALGHGFDDVPNNVKSLRDEPQPGWNTSGLNMEHEGNFGLIEYLPPGYAALAEGWATYGELYGIFNQYYCVLRNDATVWLEDPAPLALVPFLNPLSALSGIISLSRVAARQTCAIGMNYSAQAWTFAKMVQQFRTVSNIPFGDSADFHIRFIGHPMQQTSYAAGLTTNLALIQFLTEFVPCDSKGTGRCCQFDIAKYTAFRILRTDYILGATLAEAAIKSVPDLQECYKRNAEGEIVPDHGQPGLLPLECSEDPERFVQCNE